MVQYVPGKIVEAKLEVLDATGEVRRALAFDGRSPESSASPEIGARGNMLGNLRRLIAGSEAALAGTEGLPSLDTWSDPGIDGLPDPPPGDSPKK
jgi:hypothetical protein